MAMAYPHRERTYGSFGSWKESVKPFFLSGTQHVPLLLSPFGLFWFMVVLKNGCGLGGNCGVGGSMGLRYRVSMWLFVCVCLHTNGEEKNVEK